MEVKPAGTSLVSDAEFQHRAAMLMRQVEYIARLPTDNMVRSTQPQMLRTDAAVGNGGLPPAFPSAEQLATRKGSSRAAAQKPYRRPAHCHAFSAPAAPRSAPPSQNELDAASLLLNLSPSASPLQSQAGSLDISGSRQTSSTGGIDLTGCVDFLDTPDLVGIARDRITRDHVNACGWLTSMRAPPPSSPWVPEGVQHYSRWNAPCERSLASRFRSQSTGCHAPVEPSGCSFTSTVSASSTPRTAVMGHTLSSFGHTQLGADGWTEPTRMR